MLQLVALLLMVINIAVSFLVVYSIWRRFKVNNKMAKISDHLLNSYSFYSLVFVLYFFVLVSIGFHIIKLFI